MEWTATITGDCVGLILDFSLKRSFGNCVSRRVGMLVPSSLDIPVLEFSTHRLVVEHGDGLNGLDGVVVFNDGVAARLALLCAKF
jgi:hypothetical protein